MKLQKLVALSLLSVVLVACGGGKSNQGGNQRIQDNQGTDGPVTTQPNQPYKELKEEEILRECSTADVAIISLFENSVKKSDTLITNSKGKRSDSAILAGVDAIRSCDGLIALLDSVGACRWNKKTVVSTTVLFYDQYRVDQRCQNTESYLTRYDSRPPKEKQPPVAPPVKPQPQPPVVNPAPVPPSPPVSGSLRKCTDAEFSKLADGLNKKNDVADALVSKQGDFKNWKYDGSTVSSAATATKACEDLIAYHDQQPCERSKQYTGAILRQRCEKVRSYYYEFVQNKTTLNFKNADLFLDVSNFNTKYFEVDYVNTVVGCRTENVSGQVIDYSQSSAVLVKDTHFEGQMMSLKTNEGLLIQCYGLGIGSAFSKREIVRLLKEGGANLPLIYRLK